MYFFSGKLHNSKRIVEALLDLLDRGETDSQVTAAISLARIGESSERVIGKLIKCLESGDRLVRQSGCLALGHLKAKEAVPMLIKLWFVYSLFPSCAQSALYTISLGSSY